MSNLELYYFGLPNFKKKTWKAPDEVCELLVVFLLAWLLVPTSSKLEYGCS
jgi:hypothetical protein